MNQKGGSKLDSIGYFQCFLRTVKTGKGMMKQLIEMPSIMNYFVVVGHMSVKELIKTNDRLLSKWMSCTKSRIYDHRRGRTIMLNYLRLIKLMLESNPKSSDQEEASGQKTTG